MSKLKDFIAKQRATIQKGKEVTLQMKAEKLRKKMNKLQDAKPGTVTTMRKGIMTKQSPIDVMKEEYGRRKYEREQKYKGDRK